MSHSLEHSSDVPEQHGHSHGPSRSSEMEGVSNSRLLWAVALNQLLTVGQVVAGVVSGSVALLSDAAHNFNDANALLIAYIARRVSRRDADKRYTFGYRRAEMIGALVNLTLLAVIGLYLIYQGLMRLIEPVEIIGWLMAVTSILALAIDIATAWLLWSMSQGSLNVRAAFVHNIVDAIGSVAVLVGAGAIIWFEWAWVDSAITLLIAGYVLWQAAKMFPQVTRILMEGTPPELELDDVVNQLQRIDDIEGVHHLHVWELEEQHRALEAHVVVTEEAWKKLDTVKLAIRQVLLEKFSICHSTLEFEYGVQGAHLCEDNRVVPKH